MRELQFFAMMILVLVLTGCSGRTEEDSQLRPGVGFGGYVLGKSKRSEIITQSHDENYFAKKGLWFSFDSHGVLDTIVTTSAAFQTDKGVRPGDPEAQVEMHYGKGVAGNYQLQKGAEAVGAIGEKTLSYPGIQFVMAKGKVWAIVIVPET